MNVSETKKALTGLLKRTRDAGKELSGGLEDIRRRVEDLKARRIEIEQIPPTLEVALERADAFAKSLAPHGSDSLFDEARRFSRGSEYYAMPDYRDKSAPMQLWLAPLIGDTIKAEVKKHYAENPGIEEDERRSRIDKIDREILDAELAEESIVRAAEDAGFPMMRRPDADPAAVLAHSKALP